MFAYERTWEVFTDETTAEGFIGYEYAVEESEALAKTIVKYGALKDGASTITLLKRLNGQKKTFSQ